MKAAPPKAVGNAGKPGAGGPLAGFVLHQYDWSETSLIVELFTRERGRIAVAAKGAKRPTSNFRAVLLPFHRLQLQLGRTAADEAGEILPLRGVEIHGWQGGLPQAGAALFAGFYANELLLKLLARQDPHAALFDHYAALLPWLTTPDAQPALRAFELALLRELGWLPELHAVTPTGEPITATLSYQLDAELGLVPVPGGGHAGLAGSDWLRLEAALTHGGFAPLLQATGPVASALRAPLRRVLHYHLPASALRTRKVLDSVQALLPR